MKFAVYKNLGGIKKLILDTLFPINCLSCGKHGVWLCDSCLKKIPLRTEQVCPVCEKLITPDGRICFGCHKKLAINGLLAASSYQNEAVASAVHCLKYRFIEELAAPLGKILVNGLLNSQLSIPDVIVPIPLHKKRLRWRGFNQAELLANYLSKNLTPGFEIPVINNLLVRRKYTRPQMEIKNYSRRQKNIQNAFAINEKINIPSHCDSSDTKYKKNMLKNKAVLLIDDIATTGSTLFECAKVLKQNGAKEVYAVVIARQEYNKK